MYDYRAGKKRVIEILNNDLEVIKSNAIPAEEKFTFENAYYGWVTAIFVDIRDSTTLCAEGNKSKVSKIIRSFTSEVIEILRNDVNLREIGIRGDCVYAIYTSPTKNEEFEMANKTFYINTYMKMLNQLLYEKNYPILKVGIGMSTAQELVIKAGRKNVDINNLVWIGDAVTKASNLSSLGNKNGYPTIMYSNSSYINFISQLEKKNEDAREWFREYKDEKNGIYHGANILKVDFNKWINSGMPDKQK